MSWGFPRTLMADSAGLSLRMWRFAKSFSRQVRAVEQQLHADRSWKPCYPGQAASRHSRQLSLNLEAVRIVLPAHCCRQVPVPDAEIAVAAGATSAFGKDGGLCHAENPQRSVPFMLFWSVDFEVQ